MSGEQGRLEAILREHPHRLAAAVLALAVGGLVFGIAHELFPYHSANHDEGVYLQQAAMLLDGRLFLTPGSAPLREAFHPWFFVEGGRGLYAKYAPVPAAIFALGKVAGGYRLALGGIAVVNVGLGYVLAAAAFDRRTGLLAAATMAAAPLFLIQSSIFLPYAPTAALNLLFAVAYVRAVRRADRRFAALAGVAIGLAFFARPYTAVLFAVPFVAHAIWRLRSELFDGDGQLPTASVTAGVGLLFVAATLLYNAVVTGSALTFPYQAFAPLDGVGFGRRAILGYERRYTVGLALHANAVVLWTFATRWFTAGALGTAAALVGVAAFGARLGSAGHGAGQGLSRGDLQLLLVGVVVAVIAGNVAFWGNLNILGRLGDPTDGLVSTHGPFYHFDLLLPVSAFAAHGVLTTAALLRERARASVSPRTVRLGAVLLLVVALPAVGVAEANALGPATDRNAAYTEKVDRAYAPFQASPLEHALVFLPPAYGEWLNHPFQWLRNEPGFDGPAVYAVTRNPADDFAVLDAYPDRTYHRYRYHGVWTPEPRRAVTPVFERVRLVEGGAVTAQTTVAIPDRIVGLSVALRADEEVRRFDYAGQLPAEVTLDWTVTSEGATVSHPNLTTRGPARVLPLAGPQELVLTVTIVEPSGATLTYREAVLVRPTDSGVQLLWPPAASVCPLVTDCGTTGTYLEDRPETRPTGVALNTTLEAVSG